MAKVSNWYLVQFKPNSHRLAESNLNLQGFETFLPMQQVTRRKVSRFIDDFRPLFPGYMFVKAKSELAPWRTINSTIGVSKLVCFGAKPRPVPLKLISRLMRRYHASGTFLEPRTLNDGDQVELLNGPFARFIATVDNIDPENRIWVLIDLMGPKSRMRVTPDQFQLSYSANA